MPSHRSSTRMFEQTVLCCLAPPAASESEQLPILQHRTHIAIGDLDARNVDFSIIVEHIKTALRTRHIGKIAQLDDAAYAMWACGNQHYDNVGTRYNFYVYRYRIDLTSRLTVWVDFDENTSPHMRALLAGPVPDSGTPFPPDPSFSPVHRSQSPVTPGRSLNSRFNIDDSPE